MNGSSLPPSRPSSADPHQQRKRVTLVDPSPPHPSKKARLDSDAPVKDEDEDDEMDEAARKLDVRDLPPSLSRLPRLACADGPAFAPPVLHQNVERV